MRGYFEESFSCVKGKVWQQLLTQVDLRLHELVRVLNRAYQSIEDLSDLRNYLVFVQSHEVNSDVESIVEHCHEEVVYLELCCCLLEHP